MTTPYVWDGSFRDEIQCPHCNAIDQECTDYPRSLQYDGDSTETDWRNR